MNDFQPSQPNNNYQPRNTYLTNPNFKDNAKMELFGNSANGLMLGASAAYGGKKESPIFSKDIIKKENWGNRKSNWTNKNFYKSVGSQVAGGAAATLLSAPLSYGAQKFIDHKIKTDRNDNMASTIANNAIVGGTSAGVAMGTLGLTDHVAKHVAKKGLIKGLSNSAMSFGRKSGLKALGRRALGTIKGPLGLLLTGGIAAADMMRYNKGVEKQKKIREQQNKGQIMQKTAEARWWNPLDNLGEAYIHSRRARELAKGNSGKYEDVKSAIRGAKVLRNTEIAKGVAKAALIGAGGVAAKSKFDEYKDRLRGGDRTTDRLNYGYGTGS